MARRNYFNWRADIFGLAGSPWQPYCLRANQTSLHLHARKRVPVGFFWNREQKQAEAPLHSFLLRIPGQTICFDYLFSAVQARFSAQTTNSTPQFKPAVPQRSQSACHEHCS